VNAINRLTPWASKALSAAAKDRKFREVMDLSGERVLLGRSAIIAGWIVGGTGVVCLLASAVTVATLFPLKQTEVRFYQVDQSTGIISAPVSIQDAPKIFSEAQDRQYLRRYIEAREGWVYEMDQRNAHLANVMSTAEEQARIADKRTAATSPAKLLGKDGHIQIENFRFHQLAGGRGRTRSYLIQFDATVWRGMQKESTKPYSATADFQWHPELPMTPDDRSDNAGGFQVIAYSANPDTPDTRRQ
jgi:type IV secretory pathway component VirB8